MVIEFCQSPQKEGMSYVFRNPSTKVFQKKHMTQPHPPFLAIEKTQLPLDNGGVSNGDQIFSFTISHTPTIKWQLTNFNHPKGHGGMIFSKIDITRAHPFWLPKNFSHHPTYPHRQMATKKGGAYPLIILEKKFISCFPTWVMEEFRSLFNGVGVLDGNQNVFFQSPPDTPPYLMVTNFFRLP